MKDKILHLLIVLFIFPALASAAPKEEKYLPITLTSR